MTVGQEDARSGLPAGRANPCKPARQQALVGCGTRRGKGERGLRNGLEWHVGGRQLLNMVWRFKKTK